MITVIGGSGFIGRAVLDALAERGVEASAVAAPRVTTAAREPGVISEAARTHQATAQLATMLQGSDCVINCAGVAEAGNGASDELYGANALLPVIVAEAARTAEVARFVQVSSAGVQGRRTVLDESAEVAPLSPYTASKAAAEAALAGRPGISIFRPTSVHGAGRPITERLIGFAATAAASVAGRGTRVTPQVLVQNVAEAIATISLIPDPPPIAMQPSEGLSVRDVLWLLGGREPRQVPTPIARALVSLGFVLGRFNSHIVAQARRLEMLWFGQEQAPTWLESHGWQAPLGRDAWNELARSHRVAAHKERLGNG